MPECKRQPNSEALEKLTRFVDAFVALKEDDIKTPAEWKAFVDRHTLEGWEDRLHFDNLLHNFGFEKEWLCG